MSIILSIDPGGTTGWSTWEYTAMTPLLPIEHGMIPGGLQGFITWWGAGRGSALAWDEIVAEDFILDSRTVKPDTTPLEILGMLEYACWLEDVPLVRQRNVMKSMAPDDLLKRLGWWWKGAGHDRDSARHVIALMRSRRHMPTLRMLGGKKEAL